MRVIAGSARHLQLKTLEGNHVRPTTDRIKETLFNIIQNDIYNCKFLDLFSGSGAIGIEALSRGAKMAVFVENSPKAYEVIKHNLDFTKLGDKAEVIPRSVKTGITELEYNNESFDIVFMDPPYGNRLEKNVLEQLKKSVIISNDTIVIVEASLDTNFDYLDSLGYSIYKEKRYKTNKHLFLKRDRV